MNYEDHHMESIQSKGGKARAKNMTKEQRSKASSVAAKARWTGKTPKPPRKAVQIASVMDSVGKYLVLCVCDDGSIWQLANLYRDRGKEPEWEPFPVPPQRGGG